MSDVVPAIVGTGLAVPEQVRNNFDPVLAQLFKQNQDLFTGYDERRVLGPGETVTSIMVAAAVAALNDAKITAASIDLLLGYASVPQYISPNSLAAVHAELGLSATTPIIPVADDFTNFTTSVSIADSFIKLGRATNVLIVCGSNWTQYVDYTNALNGGIGTGDGAGAAVMSACTGHGQWQLVDQEHLVASNDYGDMFMAGDPIAGSSPPSFTSPTFHITPAGGLAFHSFGGVAAPETVTALMKRNNVTAAEATVLPHQSSLNLIKLWQQSWGTELSVLTTLGTYGNIVHAAVPVNLATYTASIETEYVILFGLGTELHASAMLLRRT